MAASSFQRKFSMIVSGGVEFDRRVSPTNDCILRCSDSATKYSKVYLIIKGQYEIYPMVETYKDSMGKSPMSSVTM